MLNRHLTFQNLIDVAILIGAIVVSTVVAYGQDPTPQPPAPTPTVSLAIEGPFIDGKLSDTGKRDDYNDFKATGGPAKGTFQWIAIPLDNKLKLRESDDGRSLSVVGGPGNYTLLLVVSDGTAKQFDQHDFVIPGDAPTPPPGPPKPVPVVKTLRDLAGPDATKVEKLYADMLEAIGRGLFDTVERFKSVTAESAKERGIERNLAVLECTKRLSFATLDAIKGELAKIVEELKTGPTPTVGKKHIVILRESADDTADHARIWNQLRTGDAAAYLAAKGHKLDILDDDSIGPDGQPAKLVTELKPLATSLPFMFILEQSDGRPLHSQAVPATASQVLEVIKNHGG
jgi:hypothetical protein